MWGDHNIDIELNDEQKAYIEKHLHENEVKYNEIWNESLLDLFLFHTNFKEVAHTTESPNRWTYYRETIYKIGERYFALNRECPNTEQQEGGTFQHYFYEVEPQEVRTIIYKKLENGK